MKKIRAFKRCHCCVNGQVGFYYCGSFFPGGKCKKCNGTGYLK
jgi:hypothetical protein